MTQDDIVTVRRWFAEELPHVARVRSPVVTRAFASVPREHFAGPGPWRLLSPAYLQNTWTTDDDDPRHLHHDVLIAIDRAPEEPDETCWLAGDGWWLSMAPVEA